MTSKPPMKDCPFCAETGVVSEAKAAEVNAEFPSPMIVAGRCLCIVSWTEMAPHVVQICQEVADGKRS